MGIAVPLVLLFILVLIVVPLWTFISVKTLKEDRDALAHRLSRLEEELRELRRKLVPDVASPPPPPPPVSAAPAIAAPAPAEPAICPAPVAPPPSPVAPRLSPPVSRREPALNLEQFVGAKLFAWLGGLTAFLAVAFFVKYSFEHDLIPPEVRVSIGFLLGAALVVAGLRITADKYRVLSQVLCATGIVSLYAVIFACHTVYRFAVFTPLATFLLMALLTAAAFLLAVRKQAQVVALLGLLGGFLTPILVSTGEDNPLGLFGYIALLDLGLIAVALHRRWHYLVPLAAAGTVLLQIGWMNPFFAAPRAPLAMTICLSFSALFAAAAALARRWQRTSPHVTWSAAALPLVALGFAFYFLGYPSIAARPALLFTFVFLADGFLLWLAWREARAASVHLVAGALVFVLLAAWTSQSLTGELMSWALGAYVVFAALHTALPLALERVQPAAAPTRWSQLFPPLTLVLLLLPLFKLDTVSPLFWPALLLLDAMAVALALLSGSLLAVALVLVLTLGAAGVCIMKASLALELSSSLFFIVGGFAVFFFAAGLFLARRFADAPRDARGLERLLGHPAAQIPAFATLLPFILLVMMSQQLPLPNPTPLFGLALLLSILALGLTRLMSIEWLPACALAGLAALEFAWHSAHFSPAHATTVLAWDAGFYLLFAVLPFLFRRSFAAATGPWAVAALSGVVHFPVVYYVVHLTWPNDVMGLLPALFALAPLASLVAVRRAPAVDPAARLNQLAWFGGVALLFITLIFPIQFERQWITLAWALEGAALLWLFHRVPHRGLQATGVALLAIAFIRLALNPAVLAYQVRGDTPIFNWYLYTYGIAIACLFTGARLAAPPRDRVLNLSAPALLNSLGAVLAFLLLNLEIADYFSPPGTATLVFEFSGSFARDMACTIAWSLFALALLGAGIWRKTRAARYAALALLAVTLLKLFFHDLAHLGQLHRVGALVGVAVVAILASFLYQRFAPGDEPAPGGNQPG